MGQQPPSGVPVNAYSVGLSLCGRDFFEPNIKPFAECVIPFVCFVHVATSFIKIPHIGCLNSNKGEDEKQKNRKYFRFFNSKSVDKESCFAYNNSGDIASPLRGYISAHK